MQNIITSIVVGAMTLAGIPSTETYERVEEPLSVQELVSHYADEFGVSQELAHYVAFNESSYNPQAVGDMNITCNDKRSPNYGKPVRARGIMQLTDCWYYGVSDEEAFDAETNIKIGMAVIAKGRTTCISQFSTCREYYKNL